MRNKKLDIKKILVIRNDKIGDLVLSTNALSLLRSTFPNAIIDIIVSNNNKQLVEKNKSIRKIFVLGYAPRKLKDFLKYLSLSKKIKKERYDLGVEIRGSLINTFFLLVLGNVKQKIGFYTNPLSRLFLDYAHLKDYNGHATKNMVLMINGGLGTKYKETWPIICTDKNDEKKLNLFLKKGKISRYISICIDASNKNKQLSFAKLDELIHFLHNRYPFHKLLLVGINKNLMNKLSQRNPYCIRVYKKNLRFLFLLFKKSEIVIGPDGGTMHLAWASRTKTLVLIPEYLRKFVEDIKPLGEKSRFLVKSFKKMNLSDIRAPLNELMTLKKTINPLF